MKAVTTTDQENKRISEGEISEDSTKLMLDNSHNSE